MEEWNKAQILFHLWQGVCFNCSSYWAEWVRKTLLLRHNFWTTHVPNDASWIWRKVLNLRELAARFIQYKVRNDLYIRLWQDPWLENHPLLDILSIPLCLILDSLLIPLSLQCQSFHNLGCHTLYWIICQLVQNGLAQYEGS